MTEVVIKVRRGLKILYQVPQARRRIRPQYSWEDLFSFARSFGEGFLNPLQRQNEICSFLHETESLRAHTLMEIGTAQGGNLFMLARACTPNACVISLDLPGGEGGGGYPAWKTPIFRQILVPGQRAFFVRGDSHAMETLERVAAILQGNKLDVLFIDGDHSYVGAKQDFERYKQLVRPGGIVAIHDIVPAKHHPEIEVSRLWTEIKAEHKVKEFVDDWHQDGMGIGMVSC